MDIVLDALGWQARRHRDYDRTRLNGFLGIINNLPGPTTHRFSDGPLDAEMLAEFDVLVLTTRTHRAFSSSEVEGIDGLLKRDGGVLLMSNHGDWPGQNDFDSRRFDAGLADRFGITLERTWFEAGAPSPNNLEAYVRFCGSTLNGKHPIISGTPWSAPVKTLVSNNFCGVRGDPGEEIVGIPAGVVERHCRMSREGLSFAIAREFKGGGRLVVVGDSGFASSDSWTGPGLFDHEDNRFFVENSLRWLGQLVGGSDS
jgi:hypothetical protein